MTERACRLNRAPVGPARAPPLSRVRSCANGPGLDHRDCPPQPFSHPTSSRTRRSAALGCSRLPMKFTEEAVMHIHRGIEVGMAFVVASGARKELAPFADDPCPA